MGKIFFITHNKSHNQPPIFENAKFILQGYLKNWMHGFFSFPKGEMAYTKLIFQDLTPSRAIFIQKFF